jgi:hypothetical protein
MTPSLGGHRDWALATPPILLVEQKYYLRDM